MILDYVGSYVLASNSKFASIFLLVSISFSPVHSGKPTLIDDPLHRSIRILFVFSSMLIDY